MHRRTPWVLLVLVCAAGTLQGASAVSAAQEGDRAAQRVERTPDGRYVVRGAQPVRTLGPFTLDADLRDLPAPPEWQPGDPIKEIPRRTYPIHQAPPVSDQLIPDPLLDRQPNPPEGNTRDFDIPILNFDAQNFSGVSPPDTVGDVGLAHYIQVINNSSSSSVRVHDKNGNVMATFLMTSLGAPFPCNTGRGDPIVLYDAMADRWLLAEFGSGNTVCVYISRTPDPVTGGWWNYVVNATTFPDYPKFGVWPDAYYMTANEGDAPPAYALDRTNMLTGAVARATQRFTAPGLPAFGFEALTPADLDGATLPPAGAPAIFARHRDDEVHNPPGTAGGDPIEMWEFHVDFAAPANSTFTQLPSVIVSEFSSEMCGISSFSCIPQPGTATRLDPLTEILMFRLVYRNFGTHQTLLGVLTVDADGEPDNPPDLERTGPRWLELRKTTGGWTLFQEGTHSPDPNPRWMGSIAMDGDGNIALGYNVSNNSPAVFPSLRYAGRLATDPPGTLRAEVNLVAGIASNGTIRYGDYAAMSVDPVDDCTFWFTGEYNPASAWRTRIGSMKFDGCGNAIPANNAVFDNGLQVPSCAVTGRSCDSAALLVGRDTITGGNEPNQPNTIADSCADGTVGRFHVRESIDRIKVSTLDGTQLAPGKVVRVDVTVWGYSRGLADTLDVYYTGTAATPVWTYLGTVKSGKAGLHTISLTYTLPAGSMQAVRARYRYRGERAACGVGDYTDHDDLAFLAQ